MVASLLWHLFSAFTLLVFMWLLVVSAVGFGCYVDHYRSSLAYCGVESISSGTMSCGCYGCAVELLAFCYLEHVEALWVMIIILYVTKDLRCRQAISDSLVHLCLLCWKGFSGESIVVVFYLDGIHPVLVLGRRFCDLLCSSMSRRGLVGLPGFSSLHSLAYPDYSLLH